MDVVENPSGGAPFDIFAGDNLARQQRLARAYRKYGEAGLKRELAAMEAAEADPKSAKPPVAPTSTSSEPEDDGRPLLHAVIINDEGEIVGPGYHPSPDSSTPTPSGNPK